MRRSTQNKMMVIWHHLFTGLTLLVAWSFAQQTCAQQTSPAKTATEAGTADADDEVMRPTLELGKFKIHDLRPTRNETAKVTFSMHLAFSKNLSKKQVAQLERWRHRLRNEVIVAVRTSSTKEFQEPRLSHLSRKVLIRVNRLFKMKIAEEVLFTEYMFRTH